MNSSVTEELKVVSAAVLERPFAVPHGPQVGAAALAKRCLDVFGAIIGIIVFSPVLILASIAIYLESGRPILFRQKRVGEGGRVITVYKFRSMVKNAEHLLDEVRSHNEIKDGPIFKWRADTRITRVGRWLRRTSMDELPQLFNVLLGNMSLVGPRPPLESEVVRYEDWQMRRLAAKPGLTGLWQVSGRSELSFNEMVLLDIAYIETWSFWSDVWLILRTPFAVISGRGAF